MLQSGVGHVEALRRGQSWQRQQARGHDDQPEQGTGGRGVTSAGNRHFPRVRNAFEGGVSGANRKGMGESGCGRTSDCRCNVVSRAQ